jgi:cystathionine beta-lyase/cystathionine gamma-synthase
MSLDGFGRPTPAGLPDTHGDVLGGIVLASRDRVRELRRHVGIHLGATFNPMAAWLTLRSLETLPLRMAAHSAHAMRVATSLEAHPRVRRVFYPGLASHPQHALAQRQMACPPGLIAVQVDAAGSVARTVAAHARRWRYAVSFGHTRSGLYYLRTDAMQASLRLSPAHLTQYRSVAGDGVFSPVRWPRGSRRPVRGYRPLPRMSAAPE